MALLRMLSFANASQEPRAIPKASAARTAPAPVPRATSAAPATMASPTAQLAAAGVTAFDGDWPGLVERSRLTGMAGMAARHAELVSFENNVLELVVPETHRMYAEKPYLEKLKAELARLFGSGLRVTVRVGPTAGTSLAAAKSREVAQRQASAAEAIEDDPFVRDLVRDLGAEVVSSSIRPADEAPGGQTSDKR